MASSNADSVVATAKASSKGKGRGASYPSFSLADAIEKLKKFWDEEKRAAVPSSAAVKHWGYGEKSSGGRQAISTLLQYGLLRDQGSGDQRRLLVSDLGMDVLLREAGTPEHNLALRTSAKCPKLFDAILSHFSDGLPSDATLNHFLIRDKDIHADTVGAVIKNFRDTVTYANLLRSDSIPAKEGNLEGVTDGGMKDSPKVGDFIQWEAGGVLKLEAPRRVRAIQQADGADWVFVEGSETGIPMNETSVVERAQKAQQQAPMKPPLLPEIPAMALGLPSEREWLRGPLSKDSGYRLLVTGDVGAREIGKLIKLLEAQKSVFIDEDED